MTTDEGGAKAEGPAEPEPHAEQGCKLENTSSMALSVRKGSEPTPPQGALRQRDRGQGRQVAGSCTDASSTRVVKTVKGYRDQPTDRCFGWQAAGCSECVHAVAGELLGWYVGAEVASGCDLDE